MGAGPNFLLDKGFTANGTTAYAVGEAVTLDTAVQSMKRIGAAATAADVVMIAMEAVDASKLVANPGKITLRARMLGIGRGIAGAAVAKGARLTTNASSRFVTQGSAGGIVVGVALEAAAGDGSSFEILLTPASTL